MSKEAAAAAWLALSLLPPFDAVFELGERICCCCFVAPEPLLDELDELDEDEDEDEQDEFELLQLDADEPTMMENINIDL